MIRDVTPSTRSFPQALSRGRARVEHVPLLSAAHPALAATLAAFDEAEAVALALTLAGEPEPGAFSPLLHASALPLLRADPVAAPEALLVTRALGFDAALVLPSRVAGLPELFAAASAYRLSLVPLCASAEDLRRSLACRLEAVAFPLDAQGELPGFARGAALERLVVLAVAPGWDGGGAGAEANAEARAKAEANAEGEREGERGGGGEGEGEGGGGREGERGGGGEAGAEADASAGASARAIGIARSLRGRVDALLDPSLALGSDAAGAFRRTVV